jgi:hypothetical protein
MKMSKRLLIGLPHEKEMDQLAVIGHELAPIPAGCHTGQASETQKRKTPADPHRCRDWNGLSERMRPKTPIECLPAESAGGQSTANAHRRDNGGGPDCKTSSSPGLLPNIMPGCAGDSPGDQDRCDGQQHATKPKENSQSRWHDRRLRRRGIQRQMNQPASLCAIH